MVVYQPVKGVHAARPIGIEKCQPGRRGNRQSFAIGHNIRDVVGNEPVRARRSTCSCDPEEDMRTKPFAVATATVPDFASGQILFTQKTCSFSTCKLRVSSGNRSSRGRSTRPTVVRSDPRPAPNIWIA